MSANINTLRKRIAQLQAERRDIQALGRSRAEIRASIEAYARGAAAAGRYRLDQAVVEDDIASLFTLRDPAPGVAPNVAHLFAALLGPDALAAALSAGVDDVADDTMLPDARRARLAEIAAELDALEADEERLIEAAEARGEPIARRPDCRPEIVLALPPAPAAGTSEVPA